MVSGALPMALPSDPWLDYLRNQGRSDASARTPAATTAGLGLPPGLSTAFLWRVQAEVRALGTRAVGGALQLGITPEVGPNLLYGMNAQNLTFGVNAPNVHTGMNAQNLPFGANTQNLPFGANTQNVPFSLNTLCPNVNPLPTTNVDSGTQMNAATFASALGSGLSEHPQRVVHSAMDLLGKPSLPGGHAAHPQGRLSGNAVIAQALSQALSGEKRPIPCWNGATTPLRSWLKLLALWEHESQIPQDKRGIKLLQSFPEGSQPRHIADTVPTDILISAQGYSAILSKLLEKYGPFLEATGPQAVDKFLFEGERGRGESFSSFVATKELARQEMESHLGEHVSDRLCGRILLRQANLNEL